jgi:regulator of replication initiation timing
MKNLRVSSHIVSCCRWTTTVSAIAFVIAVVLLPLPVAFAGIGFQPVVPEELKMTADPQAPGAPAIILFRQVDRDDNGRTSHEDDYFRIKILKEEGRKYADIEIPFFTSSERIVNVSARTIRPDGSVANFDGKVFDKSIVKAKGLKYLAKTFTLPDVQVGSVIEYYFTRDLTEHYIYDSHWILSQDLFTRNARFSLKPYQSDYQRFTCRWSWQDLPPGTAQPKEGPDHIIRLDAQNIPAFQTEDFMPPENEVKARVDFTYSDEPFESDIDKFWRKVGKKLNGQMEDFVGKHKAMEQAVAQIVSPNDSLEVKLQKIYARVQQVRNTSYEVRKTEQEEKRSKEKDVSNVEDIWKRGYSDGFHLTWLYLALVRAAGLEAHGVWVSDRRNYFFKPQLMDPTKLDANVVQVKLNGKEIYCDPGAAFAPFGLLPWTETGVGGLLLDKDGGTWIVTNLPESSASSVERSAKLKFDESSGGVEGKLIVTFTGLEAMWRRVEERNEDEANRKKFLEDQVREYIPAAIEVELTNNPNWGASEPPLVAEFDLKVPGWVSGAGRRALLPLGLFSAAEKHLFDHADRIHAVYFQYPSQKVDDVTVQLPLGWQVTSSPKPQIQDGHVITYSLKVDHDAGALHWTRRLNVDVLYLEPKYYPSLRTFFQGVRTGDDEQVVLQPATATTAD